MKIFNFNTYNEFLERFDGRIYSVNYDNSYVCDLHQEDWEKFVNQGKLDNDDYHQDYFITHIDYKQEILSEAIYINVREKL